MDLGRLGAADRPAFCECAEGQKQQRLAWLSVCGVPRARRDETLDAFQKLPGTEDALRAARAVAAGDLGWLLIYGGTGNGKSHLGHGIVLQRIESGKAARMINSLVFLGDMRAVSGTPAQSYLMRELATIPLLVLDDMFWATDFEARWIEELIQRRYMDKRPTVANTNGDLKGLASSLVGRFLELGRVVLNKGADYRRARRP